MNPVQPSSSRAFSLTETVIALGLFAFCILPIVGLIPVGVGAARSVNQEGQSAALADAFFGAWEVRPGNSKEFGIPVMFPTNSPFGLTNAVPLTAKNGKFFFAGNGAQVLSGTEASMSMAYAISNKGGAMSVDLVFEWPANTASGNSPSTNPAAQVRTFSRAFPL